MRQSAMASPSPDAERLLHSGNFEAAIKAAVARCDGAANDEECSHLLSIVLQADYHLGRLKDLQELQQVSSRPLGAIKIQVVLLWGVIALELGKLQEARQVLLQYIDVQEGAQLAAEDAVALARLYAVWLLGKACSSTCAARSWLQQQRQLPLKPHELKELLGELDALDAGRAASSISAQQHQKARAAFAGPAAAAAGHPGYQPSRLSAAAGPAARSAAAAAAVAPVQSGFVTMTGELDEVWHAAVQQQQRRRQHSAEIQPQESSSSEGRGSSSDGQRSWLRGLASSVREWAAAVGNTASGTLQHGVSLVTGSKPAAGDQASSHTAAGVDMTVGVVGAGLAAVVAYSLYAERQAIRRHLSKGASTVSRGLGEVLGMAVGLTPSPMAAVPHARHLQ